MSACFDWLECIEAFHQKCHRATTENVVSRNDRTVTLELARGDVDARRDQPSRCALFLPLSFYSQSRSPVNTEGFPNPYEIYALQPGVGLLGMAGFHRTTKSAKRRMRLTDSESLWTVRFSDCDYGYYVVIPNRFVAHGNRPPQRLYGVLFGLPDTSTTDVVTFDDERFISVMASSNEFDFKSPKELADHFFELSRQGQIRIRDQGAASVSARRIRNWLTGNRGTLRHRCPKLLQNSRSDQVLEQLSLLRHQRQSVLTRLFVGNFDREFSFRKPSARNSLCVQ